MGLRDRFDAAADRVATLVSSVFITAPDHPNRGGMTGDESWTDGDDVQETANGSRRGGDRERKRGGDQE